MNDAKTLVSALENEVGIVREKCISRSLVES